MGQLRLDFYQISVLEKNIFHFTFSEVQTGCHILALFWKKIVSKIEVVKNVISMFLQNYFLKDSVDS